MERETSMVEEKQTVQITPAYLEELCQGAHIERTIYLLFTLNHWAKARDRLFFVDRQGLYQVKRLLLRQVYARNLIEAQSYINGLDRFGEALACEIAADIAAEDFVWRLEELAAPPIAREESQRDRVVRRLYAKMTGRMLISVGDVEALEAPQVRDYILDQLSVLKQEARITRRPIPWEELRDLCVAPSDLLSIQDRRYYDLSSWDSWEQLDEHDLRKLDPEGLSLITFQYTSSTAHFTFHLPFRLAEKFVPPWVIAQLQQVPHASRERGVYYGRTVTDAECLQLPVRDILGELGVNIETTCPRLLSDKRKHAIAQAMRFIAWSEQQDFDEDEEVLAERDWRERGARFSVQKSNSAVKCSEEHECPLCHTLLATASGSIRLAHWQAEHANQDLTFVQASWALNLSLSKQEFHRQYPPDYRAPDARNQGTRYWRVETLANWLQTIFSKE